MEIKIGIRQSSREIALETDQSVEQISEAITAALDAGSLLSLTDSKGRTVMVPADALAYVETGTAAQHRVGFGIA